MKMVDTLLPFCSLFSISCTPWSQSNTTRTIEELEADRNKERPMIDWLVNSVVSSIHARGHMYLFQNQWKSNVWAESPLTWLMNGDSEPVDSVVDQCRHGAFDYETRQLIRKRTLFRGNRRLKQSSKRCNCVQPHAENQGSFQGVQKTAHAAEYPNALCRALLRDIQHQATLGQARMGMQ